MFTAQYVMIEYIQYCTICINTVSTHESMGISSILHFLYLPQKVFHSIIVFNRITKNTNEDTFVSQKKLGKNSDILVLQKGR